MGNASTDKDNGPQLSRSEILERYPMSPDSGERGEVFARLRDLRNRALDAELNAEAYILAIDTGAIIAILSTWGKQAAIDVWAARIALTFFGLSTLTVAAVKVVRVMRAYYRMGTFEKATARYLVTGGYLELFQRDRYARKHDSKIKWFGISAMACTIFGTIAGGLNLWSVPSSNLVEHIFLATFE